MLRRRRLPRAASLAAVVICASALGCACAARQPDPAPPSAGAGVAPQAHGLRGSLVAADSLANTRIGGPYGTVLAYRFRSRWTGVVRGVRFYVILNTDGRSGYSGGTGGTLRIALAEDRGRRRHRPGDSLAAVTMAAPARAGWPLVRFRKPVRVTAGRFYYVVFTNLDRDPERNYVSINALAAYGSRGSAPPLPDGMAVLLGGTSDGGATPRGWVSRSQRRGDRYAPILEVEGGRPDQHIGLGYMEVWVRNPKPIGGGASVRQLLGTRPANRIAGVWLRLRRDEGVSGPLTLRIERTTGGVLASRTVSASRVSADAPQWVHVRFSKPVTVTGRDPLALVATSAGQASYEAFPLRKGTEFGFHADTVFTGGYAQFAEGRSWLGWDPWGHQDVRTGDLQFALDTGR
jgi:hypothetical protein